MNLYEVTQREPQLIHQFTAIWEDSVRASHLFLSEAEIQEIKAYVPQALTGVSRLLVAERAPGQPVAFMGIEGPRLEMLFLSPAVRGAGLGRQLLEYGIRHYHLQELTVNEQPFAARLRRRPLLGDSLSRFTGNDTATQALRADPAAPPAPPLVGYTNRRDKCVTPVSFAVFL